MIHGRDLRIYIGSNAIAAAKNCTLNISQSFIEAASPVSGRTTTKIPTRYAWTLSADGLVGANDNTADLMNLLIAGTPVTLRFRDPDMWMDFTGTAYVESISVGGNVGALSTYSLQLTGSGALASTPYETITLNPTYTIDDTTINCNGTTPVIEQHDGDHVYVQGISVTAKSVLIIATTQTNACMFLHKASAGAVAEKIGDRNTAAFLNPAVTGYMAHVHGTTGYYEARLQPGTYTITWDASPAGTVRIKS